MSQRQVLIVAILMKSKGAIGGMSQRFSVLAERLIMLGYPVELVTTRSLLQHLELPENSSIRVIEDKNGRLGAAAGIVVLGVLLKLALGRYRQLHLAGGGRIGMLLWKVAGIFGVKRTCTFASRTLRMASYGRKEAEETWLKLLNEADAIDVLNPGHELGKWSSKISVSPGSFLSRKFDDGQILWENRANIAVFSGSLEATKNPLLAVDIFAAALPTLTKGAKFLLFGQGRLHSAVSERAAEINALAGYTAVEFGAPSEYFRILGQARVFFSLQNDDNYPSQSLIEAMRMGCRCVTTADGDSRLMFPDGDDNAVLATRDIGKFAAAFSTLMKRQEASMANIGAARERHSLDRFVFYMTGFLGLVR
jgi:glycosyltransferase involved in cell wall biosynthesis